ncbi:WD40 repeat-like protein [Niveomyces insectorum RCEF 264]|uniref:WD40 repeat-like protein n=1 Tax=Niveomyces insectorum RCEF 264 TaxID=1081102 RepID=A0A167ZSL2_9HYPO|nr:WD40 repeat-like protein [Niveomyces insectorum RCEF 264]
MQAAPAPASSNGGGGGGSNGHAHGHVNNVDNVTIGRSNSSSSSSNAINNGNAQLPALGPRLPPTRSTPLQLWGPTRLPAPANGGVTTPSPAIAPGPGPVVSSAAPDVDDLLPPAKRLKAGRDTGHAVHGITNGGGGGVRPLGTTAGPHPPAVLRAGASSVPGRAGPAVPAGPPALRPVLGPAASSEGPRAPAAMQAVLLVDLVSPSPTPTLTPAGPASPARAPAPAAARPPLPKAVPSNGVSAPSTPLTFKTTVENGHVVHILDDDDDDDDDNDFDAAVRRQLKLPPAPKKPVISPGNGVPPRGVTAHVPPSTSGTSSSNTPAKTPLGPKGPSTPGAAASSPLPVAKSHDVTTESILKRLSSSRFADVSGQPVHKEANARAGRVDDSNRVNGVNGVNGPSGLNGLHTPLPAGAARPLVSPTVASSAVASPAVASPVLPSASAPSPSILPPAVQSPVGQLKREAMPSRLSLFATPSAPNTPSSTPQPQEREPLGERKNDGQHRPRKDAPQGTRNTASRAAKSEPQRRDAQFIRWAALTARPYLEARHRQYLAHTEAQAALQTSGVLRPRRNDPAPAAFVHVDFLPEEVQLLLTVARSALDGVPVPSGAAKTSATPTKPSKKPVAPARELGRLVRSHGPGGITRIVRRLQPHQLPARSADDVAAFLSDVARHRCAAALGSSSFTPRTRGTPAGRTLPATWLNLPNALRTFREDGLQRRNEWTNCAGDIATISWTSNAAFLCGTTTHMDDRNHQYNRQGNLVLGSVGAGTLRAYPDHRIVRPRGRLNNGSCNDDNNDNSSDDNNSSSNDNYNNNNSSSSSNNHDALHGYDDPWLYTSVVSSDYSASHDLAFTSGFDRAVKVWRVDPNGASMTLVQTWSHTGKVNFVVASSDPAGLVATAADVPTDAVRVYRLRGGGAATAATADYKTFSCSRIVDLEGRPVFTDRWAYFPAAVRWGTVPGTRHLLLVGYSPRGLGVAAEDEDIPDDRRNSGELCLWDGVTGQRLRILGGTSQNVFEVVWHPTQPCFAAATSPVGQAVEDGVHTQIRIFRPADSSSGGGGGGEAGGGGGGAGGSDGGGCMAFSEVQVLDCFADDINELALLPNSFSFVYLAAGCTDGRTYVWDTSQGDKPIHVLHHGRCLEELSGEKISMEDTGVKFVAWGATPDRLYTGSSDGVVKVWNIRSAHRPRNRPFVRTLLECPAPVSFGAFSPDKAKLAVGDASGRVFLLAVEDGLETDDEAKGLVSGDENNDDDEDDDSKDEKTKRAPHGQQQQQKLYVRPGVFGALARRGRATFRQHPPEVIHHPTPPPPLVVASADATGTSARTTPAATTTTTGDEDDSGHARARAYLASGQLRLVADRTVGAVQGPHYDQTGLFCRTCHAGGQPANPLLAQYERDQQRNRPRASAAPCQQRALRVDGIGRVVADVDNVDTTTITTTTTHSTLALHRRNVARDLDVESLPEATRAALVAADRGALALHASGQVVDADDDDSGDGDDDGDEDDDNNSVVDEAEPMETQ